MHLNVAVVSFVIDMIDINKKDVDSFFPMEGDCYSANGGFVVDRGYLGLDDVALCHGVAILKTDGLPFGHCWVEKGDTVIDISNGNDSELPKELYYALGKIDELTVLKYSYEDVRKKILFHEHWGPWDYKPPR